MIIEICWGTESTELDLKDGKVRVGGAPEDEVCFQGLPPALLTLSVSQGRLTAVARAPLSIGNSIFPAHLARLVAAGELMRLPNQVLVRRVPEKDATERANKNTACVMKELVGDVVAPETSRAASLTCITGLDSGRAFPLAHSAISLGRADDSHLRLRDPSVSRRHATVVRVEKRYFIDPLPRTHGLFVNGLQIYKRTRLSSGDVIGLGQSALRFDGPSTPKPTPPPDATVIVLKDEVTTREPNRRPKTSLLRTPVGLAPTAPLPGPVAERLSRLEIALFVIGATLGVLGLGVIAAVLI